MKEEEYGARRKGALFGIPSLMDEVLKTDWPRGISLKCIKNYLINLTQ